MPLKAACFLVKFEVGIAHFALKIKGHPYFISGNAFLHTYSIEHTSVGNGIPDAPNVIDVFQRIGIEHQEIG
jgi:hypothetical protein